MHIHLFCIFNIISLSLLRSLNFFNFFIYSLLLKGFHATPGWDPTSGIGSVDYTKMKDYFYSLYSGPVKYSVKEVSYFAY